MSESNPDQHVTESTPYITHLPDGEPVSLGVINAVAEVSGRSFVEGSSTNETESRPLRPLYEVIDPDALDSLFLHETDNEQIAMTVSFMYAGYQVTVESSGRITVVEK